VTTHRTVAVNGISMHVVAPGQRGFGRTQCPPGVVDVPDAGHWVQMERPHEVNPALLEFFREL
jgi:hypothetical protein